MAEVKPYYQDNHIKIFNKDCRSMNEIPDNSIQCVVTSPPYWGLRKYSGVPDLIWGDNHCEHEWRSIERYHGAPVYKDKTRWQHEDGGSPLTHPDIYAVGQKGDKRVDITNTCSLCGAWKGSYGLEPTPEMYIQHTIEILREIRRVLRKDGVVFWNIGDSYFGGGFGTSPGGTEDFAQRYPKQASNLGTAEHEDRKLLGSLKKSHSILKPKDLCLIPFRVAMAAQEDGWWVRSVIIWSKPNPMPESVTDRPTESHEYIIMLTKSSKYYWDADAVRESPIPSSIARGLRGYRMPGYQSKDMNGEYDQIDGIKDWSAGRNIRSVWEFPTQPYPEAHFAVFPEKLPEICIKAATPEVGCCSKCGAPWGRITESQKGFTNGVCNSCGQPENKHIVSAKSSMVNFGEDKRTGTAIPCSVNQTLGWQPTCKCGGLIRQRPEPEAAAEATQDALDIIETNEPVPSIVLDPFAGAGTTLWVAKRLNRKAIGYELSQEYCELALNRNRQQVFI